MTTGERGPTGDHGQDGQEGKQGVAGRTGVPGETGDTGDTGAPGEPGHDGKDVLTKTQTLALFLFIVVAFLALAYRSEMNAINIRDNTKRIVQVVDELCNRTPEIAPRTCSTPAPR